MSTGNKSFGNLGEGFARGYLKRLGYRIVHAPYRCRYGEIDIIALDGDTLVFFEVKTRRSHRFGSPQESVTWNKQRHILKTAKHFLKHHGALSFRLMRFDVLSIRQETGNAPPEVMHIRDAFRDISGGWY